MSAGSPLGTELRARRNAIGLTQAELAARAGISERAISDIERGLRRVVYRDTAERLVRALELSGQEAARFEAVARGRPARAHPPTLDLPLPRTELIGRSAELKELTALIQDERTRLVTLAGPGGVGKTRLAVEVAAALAPAFAGGVVYVPLAEVRDARLVLPTIADTLKVGAGRDLAGQLRSRELLLLLDTFEHLPDGAPAIAKLLGEMTAAKFLVTSRVPLNIRAERLFQVGPLRPADAVTLFASCTRAEEPAAADRLDETAVAEICGRLDGLPLAIELAAARTRRLGLSAITSHLERRLPLLEGGPVDLPARQRSMSATIAWSYDLLPSGDRRLLEELSAFASGWTLESARAVCRSEDVLASLGRLVDSSLVLRRDDVRAPRYATLDTVREYAAQKLEDRAGTQGAQAVRRRHAQHFQALAEEAEPNLRAGGHQEWLDRLALERDNLRAALAFAIASRDAGTALRLGSALWMFWRLSGTFSEGRAWLQRVLEMDPGGHEQVRAGVLWGAGWLAYQQGDFEETARRGEELAGWARSRGHAAALRNGLTLLGEERMSGGDFAAAGDLFDDALAIARDLGSPWVLATSCLNRSVAALHLGDLATADALLDQAERLYREVGDERFLARAWLQRVYVALLRDDVPAAEEKVLEGLALALALDDGWGVAEQLDALAAVLAAAGDVNRAAFAAGAAETAWERIGACASPADRRAAERWLAPARTAAGADWDRGTAEGRTADPGKTWLLPAWPGGVAEGDGGGG